MSDTSIQKKSPTPSKSSDSPTISTLDIIRIVSGLLLLNSLLSYLITGNSLIWGHRAWYTNPKALTAALRGPIVLTDDQLAQYAGQSEDDPIYVALNGTIFDVSAGRRIYGPGGPYNFFAGRDAARAYVTGCFKEDAVADLRGVEWMFVPTDVPRFDEEADEALSEQRRFYRYTMVEQGLKEVEGTMKHWAKVFRGETGKDYFEVGYVERDPAWMDTLPLRELCAPAEKKRPKPAFDEEEIYQRPRYMRRVREVKRQQTRQAKSSEGATAKEGHSEL